MPILFNFSAASTVSVVFPEREIITAEYLSFVLVITLISDNNNSPLGIAFVSMPVTREKYLQAEMPK
jgi:hypothetical protein